MSKFRDALKEKLGRDVLAIHSVSFDTVNGWYDEELDVLSVMYEDSEGNIKYEMFSLDIVEEWFTDD